MAYKVGQVLYVVPKGKAQLVPVQVVEEITKKTLQGDIVAYMIKVGSDGQPTDVSKLDGEIFESSTRAKQVLIDRSNKAINRVVESAIATAQSWYVGAFEGTEPVEDVIGRITKQKSKDEDIVAELEDGTRVRVSLPDSLS